MSDDAFDLPWSQSVIDERRCSAVRLAATVDEENDEWPAGRG
jgi:hypothetical protein